MFSFVLCFSWCSGGPLWLQVVFSIEQPLCQLPFLQSHHQKKTLSVAGLHEQSRPQPGSPSKARESYECRDWARLSFSSFNPPANDEAVKAAFDDERMMLSKSPHNMPDSCFSSSWHPIPGSHLVCKTGRLFGYLCSFCSYFLDFCQMGSPHQSFDSVFVGKKEIKGLPPPLSINTNPTSISF